MEKKKKNSKRAEGTSEQPPTCHENSEFVSPQTFLESRRDTDFDEYLMAMKRVYRRHTLTFDDTPEILSPRARYREQAHRKKTMFDVKEKQSSEKETQRAAIIASMVPDEIISNQDYSERIYETALMFIDITGFTHLCEKYTSSAHGGPSKLTQVLNSYIGAMVLEILAHNGDVLKFSGDAFLSMWKKSEKLSMQDVVHNAIDCGLIIQKNYGTFVTDVGVTLKVKVAISAGKSHFSIIGGEKSQSSYVIVGQPVWDVKMAQYMTTAGDVLTSASAWMYVNESEYCTQPCGDGKHTKVLGVGASWKRVEKLDTTYSERSSEGTLQQEKSQEKQRTKSDKKDKENEALYMKYQLRPAVITALKSTTNVEGLRRFVAVPVLRAVDNDEPMDFLTEVRRVVVVFLNIITKTLSPDEMIGLVNTAYNCVSSVTSESGGYVNKVSMFDKDMMFLVVFGLRGLKHENEAQNAVLCAHQLTENLKDENILSVSIGVTSGSTYCGVVGHVLRREYTVIGLSVNKAARLMTTYHNMVSCDKETFLRSKLNHQYFRQLESKPLKGIAQPGPMYQFSKMGWLDRIYGHRHPILGRTEELRQFHEILQNALEQHSRAFTRYRDHKYAVVYSGVKLVGTTRLLDESLTNVPVTVRREKFYLTDNNIQPYGIIRRIMGARFNKRYGVPIIRETTEKVIQYSLSTISASPIQLHALNLIFDCRFPLPEKFEYSGDLLAEASVKDIIKQICIKNFITVWVFGIDNAQFIDVESWRLLITVLETKTIFLVMTIKTAEVTSPIVMKCLANHMIVNIPVKGIDRFFHAALACQLLDVQAIPADLEKVVESASGGLPGWVQNFVISLVQRGTLTIVTMPRFEALKLGFILPSAGLLQKSDLNQPSSQTNDTSHVSIYSYISASVLSKQDLAYERHDDDKIQVAILAEGYTFDNMNVDMTMDAIILKTYDSLNPFEKMLLKCGSVLGDVFSRRMLLHLLQGNSPRRVAEAVAKLFSIRVLECEGGDFTRDSSLVLVHAAPSMPSPKPPFCACLGTRKPPSCRDLPMYAFCGYMKFRHTEFRTTTYELLTESQKHDMHARALLYLERYTRKCIHCGAGCFAKLLGLRTDSGLVDEKEKLKRTRRQILAISAESKIGGEEGRDDTSEFSLPGDWTSHMLETDGTLMNRILGSGESQPPKQVTSKQYQENKRVRSFSSLELENCECLSILQCVYSQVIDHCHGAKQHMKLLNAYMEYADLCICINGNIPQGVRLLSEVEHLIESGKFCTENAASNWVKDFRLAAVYSLRGVCMLEMGDLIEARIQLFRAMKLYRLPFPTSKNKRYFYNVCETMKQLLAIYVVPNVYVARYSGITGYFYEDIAKTLSILFHLFKKCEEHANAELAAKWSLNYALRTNANFRVLCSSYANMIYVYRLKQKFGICVKLEKRAMESCHRKHGRLDVTEVKAVSYLYTEICLFYIHWGKKLDSLEYGLSVMHMLHSDRNSDVLQLLVLWMLKLLLCDLKIHDMVSIMTEFLYMTDTCGLGSEIWYYFYAINILLDTGYCVETLSTCEKFYIKKGDTILKSSTPEAAWNFFVVMWLVTIRIGAWERTILWEEKINHLLSKPFVERKDFDTMMMLRLTEGLLIMLVTEVDNRNINKIILLEKMIKIMFKTMKTECMRTTFFRPRFYLMLAYYDFIKGKKSNAFKLLAKSQASAREYAHNIIIIWVEHTRNHWKGALNPKYHNYWTDHVEPDNLLDYRDFDPQKGKIIPYTLPVPRDLEK